MHQARLNSQHDKASLLLSEEKMNHESLRLLKLCGVKAEKVFSILKLEQRYVVIDRKWIEKRRDLALLGRTVYGSNFKGFKIDNDFSSVKNRIRLFMKDFETAAFKLGIQVQMTQNEVIFPPERCVVAFERNLMLLGVLNQKAERHDLVLLLDEKPFAGVSGSVTNYYWSLATDKAVALFDLKENEMFFSILLTAVLRAFHEHAGLLASCFKTVFSHSKKDRETLSEYLLLCESNRSNRRSLSFFAFAENQFQFQATGLLALSTFPMKMIHAIVADSLQLILDEIGDALKDSKDLKLALPVIRKHLSKARSVFFEEESSMRNSFQAYTHFIDKKTLRAFEGILTENELRHHQERLIQEYVEKMKNEINWMVKLFRTEILPAVLKSPRDLSSPIADATDAINDLEKAQQQIVDLGWEAKGKVYCELIASKIKKARDEVDRLETLVDPMFWPLSNYKEMLIT